MRVFDRREVLRAEGYEIHVEGVKPFSVRDLYHLLLRLPWWADLVLIVGGYLLLNLLFAAVYVETDGIANAAHGSFADAFFFSVQTMGTIGYGTMYPATRLANVVVVAESVVGLGVTALATGLVFARFSQMRARVAFSARLAIGPFDDARALMIRVGNERRGLIVAVTFRLTMARTVRNENGMVTYRSVDVPLVRERAPSLSRAWIVLHRIEPGSALWGATPASLQAEDAELTLEVSGVDEVSGQHVHALRTWPATAIAWDARLADILHETPEGNLHIDLRKFHDVTPVATTAKSR